MSRSFVLYNKGIFISPFTSDKERTFMITYKPFWETLKNSPETTYTLIHKHRISSATIDRLRKDKPLSTITIDDLCQILQCQVGDIAAYVSPEDETAFKNKT